MIKYNSNTINDWNFGSDNIAKVYYGVTTSGSSRLPQGYTEVEYVENQNQAYINTGFKPNQDTRIIAEMQCVTSTNSVMHFGAGGWDRVDGMWLTYETGINGTLHVAWLGKTTWSTYGNGDYNKHTYDWNKNVLYKDGTLVGSSTYGTYQCPNNLAIFASLQGDPEYVGELYLKGKMYSFKIYDNGTLVRDFIPCIRDNDNMVGMYDLVNDVFYYPPNYTSYQLVAGSAVTPSSSTTVGNVVYQKITNGSTPPTPPSPSGLPSGYTEVEYIQRDASHDGYVGLGEYFQENTKIEIDFQMTKADGFSVVGDYYNNDSDDWRVFINYYKVANNYIAYDFEDSREYYVTSGWNQRFHIEIGNYYVKDLNSGNYWINSTPKTGFTRPNQMYLFYLEGTIIQANQDYGKVWKLKIWQGDTLVKEFVPCYRDSDNVVGLYDIVGNEFHGSLESTLIAGNPIN